MQLVATPTEAVEGQRLAAAWTLGRTDQPGDWVSLFAHDTAGAQQFDAMRRVTVDGRTSGQLETTAPAPGRYVFRYIAGGTLQVLAQSEPITVTAVGAGGGGAAEDAGADAGADGGSEDAGEGDAGGGDAGGADAGDGGAASFDAGQLGPGDGGFVMGINLSGLEFGSASPADAGSANVNYGVPTVGELDYFHTKAIDLIRVPFKWERMQRTLNGPLEPGYLGLVKALAQQANARGMRIILDVHNYGGYYGQKIGGGTVTSAHFADLWRKLAMEFVGVAGVAGYDLMNEPAGMPNPAAWPAAAQAAVDAIRQVDMSTLLYIEGDGWSAAPQWLQYNANLNINDPAKRLIYSAHCYFDRDNSGTHFDWLAETAAGVTPDIGVRRLSGFVGWLKQHGYRGHIGEIGTGNNDPGWNVALDNALAYARANSLEVTYWTAGPWWGGYPYSAERRSDGRDAKQIAVLTKYSGAPQPTAYVLTGPARGPVNAASSTFTLEYRGEVRAPVVITPTSSPAGGAFTPASVTLQPGFNAIATFTYQAPSAATYTLGATNNTGWTNPAPVTYAASTDLFGGAAASPVNVFALRKLVPAYTGAALNLRRASDNATADFGFSAAGGLDVAALATWAAGARMYVVKWYDQSPHAYDAKPVFSDNMGGGAATDADQPELILNARNGKPIVRFDNSRMDAVSPLDGLTGHTILTCFKPTTVLRAQRLLSWQFNDASVFPDANGKWTTSVDAPSALDAGIDATGWHTYFGRWRASAANGKQTFKDGALVAQQTIGTAALRLAYRNNVNLGWFRWAPGITFGGDVAEIITFDGALSDGDLARFQATMKGYWGTP